MAVFVTTKGYGNVPYGKQGYGGNGAAHKKFQNKAAFLLESHLDLSTASYTVDSTAPGFVSGLLDKSKGDGSVSIQGAYAGGEELIVKVKITNSGDGTVCSTTNPADTGAKYVFSLNGGGTYYDNAGHHYNTHTNHSSTPVELADIGITLSFSNSSSGVLRSFYDNDEFSFLARNLYAAKNLTLWTKELYWKSLTSEVNICIDYGIGGRKTNAIVLHAHNLIPSSDRIDIYAYSDNGFTNEVKKYENIPFTFNQAALFLEYPDTYTYWKIKLTKTGSDPIQVAHLYMGNCIQLTKDISNGFSFEDRRFVTETEFKSGKLKRSVSGLRKQFKANFTNLTNPEDFDSVSHIWRLVNEEGAFSRPFYIVNRPTDNADYLWCQFDMDELSVSYNSRNKFDWDVNLVEGY